jgi:hypothetical protein
MVCVGHTNSCPAHVGYIGPNEALTYTDYPYTTTTIKALDVQELKNAITDGATRRSVVLQNVIPNVTSGQSIQNETYKTSRDAIGEINVPITDLIAKKLDDASLEDGDIAENETMKSLVDEIEILRNACLCNCDYGCTCDCNHSCTCNCNYACTCNCNYACTCNCAYSDERLKTEVEAL